MNNKMRSFIDVAKIVIGCTMFGAGFNLFMVPNDMNAGGLSGLSMIVVHWLGFGTVGLTTVLINIPLFALGGWKIGKKFFASSLVGMLASSVAIDLLSALPVKRLRLWLFPRSCGS